MRVPHSEQARWSAGEVRPYESDRLACLPARPAPVDCDNDEIVKEPFLRIPTIPSAKKEISMKNHKSPLGWLAALLICVGPSNAPAQTNSQTASNSGTSDSAQAAPSTPAPSDQENPINQVVQMSAFEVITTQGNGYVATTAATAFKTDQALMDIPQGDVVVTNDLIKDINYENSTDVLQYFGVEQNIQGAVMQMRGTSLLSFPYLDEMPNVMYYQDDAVIDSYEVVKGAAQTLYVGAGLAGVVLETTKKPLPYDQNIVTASIDQWGLFRITIDSTGPLGKVGDFDFGYRLVAVYQHGNEYFNNTSDDRYSVFPELGLKYKNTTVRAYWNPLKATATPGMAFVTPTGQLETAMGWKGENNVGPYNAPEYWAGRTIFVEVLQKISDNWENRLSAADWRYDVDGPYGGEFAENVNFDNNTETWGLERSDEHWAYWTVLDDYQGHYQIGPDNWRMNQSDAFGFAYSSSTDKQFYFDTAPFPYPNGPVGGSITVPFNNPSALGTLVAPPANDISPPPTSVWTSEAYANDLQIQTAAIYWQHTMDLVPNWFTIITGWTWDSVATQSVSDWAVLPWQGTNISLSQWVHRLGAVVHLGKSVSLYALDSTNFLVPYSNTLENGTLPPPQVGIGTELGVKWNFGNGKITGEAAWFKAVTTNGLNLSAGTLPSGVLYAAVIGSITEEESMAMRRSRSCRAGS